MTTIPTGSALVTGGASGIGSAVVTALVADGVSTLVVDRDEAGAARVACELRQPFSVADVTDPSDWARLAAQTFDPPLRSVVLGAGVNGGDEGGDLHGLSDDRIASIVGVNLTGVVLGVRALAPVLARSGGGSIAVVASGAGLAPFDRDPVYSAAKTGAVTFVRAAAEALTAVGVVLTAVCPTTPVDTPMLTPAVRERIAASGRAPTSPAVVAAAIVEALALAPAGAVHAVGDDGQLTLA